MIHISYKLDKSIHHGIGLFTTEDIPAGTLVYSASPLLDLEITNDVYMNLSEQEKNEIRYWGFWIESKQVWHVDFDMSKFINHSPNANLSQDQSHEDAYLISTRVIQSGEELTQNYLEFETLEDLEKRGIFTPSPSHPPSR